MIPASYQVNMLGATLSDKIYVYAAATQVTFHTIIRLYKLLTPSNNSSCSPIHHPLSFPQCVD